MRTPRLYLGTMTFSWSQTSSRVDEPVALEMVQRFLRHNSQASEQNHYIDTARIYAGGKTELTVGATVSKAFSSESTGSSASDARILLGTKAHPSQPHGLSPKGIQAQMQASIDALGKECMGVIDNTFHEFYLHQPDTEHSLLESLQCLHELVLQGRIRHIGMSNYHASEMERAFALCAEHSLTPPTVYQGLYNPLNRIVEEELLPVLKKNNCAFVAYNPLAAGLLAGKHTDPENATKGRFKNNPNYLPRFYTKSNFEAIQVIRKACEQHGIHMVEATYRWLLCHSALGPDDGILLGASSLEQLDQNLAACQAPEPLPESVVDAINKASKLIEQPFPYWRSYSSDMPNGPNLDQGASYSAAKK